MKFDAIVIGKGPAGVTAAIYLARAGYGVGVIAHDFGALAKAEKIENYYGFVEPISGAELAERGQAQAERLGVTFFDGEAVGASFGDGFSVRTERGEEYRADVLVFATGSARKKPKVRDLEKYEGAGVSYCAVCDAFFFRKKKVAVLGSGEYARNEVEELKPLASSVIVLTDGEEPTAAFDVPVVKKKLDVLFADLSDTGLAGAFFTDGTAEKFDGLFVAVGRAGTAELARKLGAYVENGEIVTDEDRATTVPGVYAAGDCVKGIKQVSKAVDDGMKAGLAAVKYLRGLKK